ncbi:MAG: acyltransferase [Pseudobutyrivibrio sp.]|nr:acyltransferase [Pseudobutyrivibrio sp.]
MATTNTRKRLDQLDTLRFLSMVLIVFNHTWGRFNYPYQDRLMFFYNIGTIANYMFFMISGLLIAMFYKERIEKGMTFNEFFFGRYLNIFPMYFMGVLCQILVILLYRAENTLTVKNLVLAFLMIPCGWTTEDIAAAYNVPTWFIAVLLLCYIIYYFIIKLSQKFPNVYFISLIIMVVWGMILLERSWNFPFNFRINGEGYANFFLGVLVCEVYNRSKELKYEYFIDILLAVIFVIIAITSAIHGIENVSGDLRWTLILLDVCILYLAINNKILGRILSFKPLAWLGTLTMEMCFLHIPSAGAYQYVMYNVRRFIPSDAGNMFAYWVILFGLSVAFHYGWTKRINLKVLFQKK